MIKILIADDHVIFRDGIKAILEHEKEIKIIGEVSDGFEAIKKANELKPDIVLMDISMNKLNGIEATRLIKKANPDINIIALSMHLNKQIVVQALKAGVSGYVLKDASRSELVQAINTTDRGKQFLSSDVSDMILEEITSNSQSE